MVEFDLAIVGDITNDSINTVLVGESTNKAKNIIFLLQLTIVLALMGIVLVKTITVYV